MPNTALTLVILTSIGSTGSLHNVQASPSCGPLANAYMSLERQYGEREMATMTLSDGTRLIILANVGSGTWTLLSIAPDGVTACMVAAGDSFSIARGI